VAYLLKARIVESQQPIFARELPLNNRVIVFSAQSVPMAVYATVECVMPSKSALQQKKHVFCSVRAEDV
jgi:hypothetical protein